MSVRSGGLERKSKAATEIPSSSMADIAFLLLIFFMVSTVFQADKNRDIDWASAEATEKIAPGKQTREQVQETLGTPSTRGNFAGDEIWFYIGKRTETTAFFAPDVLEHQVLEIRFGEDGRVSRVSQIDATKAAKPRPVDRETPTEGKKLTILEQFIGNIGRFTPVGTR